jgi:hypothetical protein
MNLALPNLSLGFLKFELEINLHFGMSKNMSARKIQNRITHMEAIAGRVKSVTEVWIEAKRLLRIGK